QEIRIDGAVALFTLAISMATGLVFAAVPALPGRRDLAASIRDGGARTSTGAARGRLRAGLVVAQVAFSVVVLIGAGLMLRSLVRLEALDPGFHAEHVLTLRVDLDWSRMPKERKERLAALTTAYDRMLERLRRTPGVIDAAVATTFPLAQVDP